MNESTNMPRLSGYPARKILVACQKCDLRVQYDRNAMLAVGGDRTLGELLDSVARRHGCALDDKPGVNVYDKCGANFPELPKLLKAAGRL
jgi:hypothetical protein